MRPPPLPLLEEHDYIGLSESMDASPSKLLSPVVEEEDDDDDRLKETELRLGLPGSDGHGRKEKDSGGSDLTLGFSKSFGLGAKRGFAAAIDGAGKWGFPGGCGNEVESDKGAALFSPRGDNGNRMGTEVGGKGLKDCSAGGKAFADEKKGGGAPAAKAQVVGWPPIRNYRKNTMAANPSKSDDILEDKQCSSCLYIKVSMDSAPYLRKVDIRRYCDYKELSKALEKMFSCFIKGHRGSHGLTSNDTECHASDPHVLTYKDKDGDWMLVGDVPWEMFTDTCKRLRIMKGSEAIGLVPQAAEKLKSKQ